MAVAEGVADAVGDGVGVVDLPGVSLGSGVGEDFFFRRGDAVGVGVGETFFFGLGVGEGDFFSVRCETFFFRGAGVGVVKIFLIVFVSDGSAARVGATAKAIHAIRTSVRSNM